MADLVEHIEQYCGKIRGGWALDENGDKAPFQVIQTEGGPNPEAQTICTLGLSNFRLASRQTEKSIRHELLLLLRKNLEPSNLPALVQQVGLEALTRGSAYLRGEVLGPRTSLTENSTTAAFYVAQPVYFPDGFHSFTRDDGEQVVFAWLAPITTVEAKFIAKHGWEHFEDELLKQNPDLIDFNRSSMLFANRV
ncbi:MAG: suppressor of fused domain protein [Planctomycetes bacterium]|nr:suppressor of fused domain protein [Planctomycetota bacterium]